MDNRFNLKLPQIFVCWISLCFRDTRYLPLFRTNVKLYVFSYDLCVIGGGGCKVVLSCEWQHIGCWLFSLCPAEAMYS